MVATRRHLNCVTPPYILKRLIESSDEGIRQAALNTLINTAHLRGERAVRASFAGAAPPGNGRRTVFDCRNGRDISSATLARSESDPPVTDTPVNRAFDGLGATRDFFMKIFNRDSIDDHGMRLQGYVHYGMKYNNAFWDGQQMVFGDGDGRVFSDFTAAIDVITHELTHGVTEHTAGLEYHNQSGALNESMSDVFGSMVKQWVLNQKAADADWLIGAEVFTPGIKADALRSVKAPGTAFNNDLFGRDPQPDHMSRYVTMPDSDDTDNGGVHINSGIPNKAFYLTAVGIGGYSWEAPGRLWYESLKASSARTDFQAFADTTYWKAGQLYGAGSNEQKSVLAAWDGVGIRVSGVAAPRERALAGNGHSRAHDDEAVPALIPQIEALLSAQVSALAESVRALRARP